MIFVDSNIFLHAFLKPRRVLTRKEKGIKEGAKAIVERLQKGEEFAITTAHLSEVVNIIEAGLGLEQSLGFLAWMGVCENARITPVAMKDYEQALPVARDRGVSANDALAYISMREMDISKVYSFDRHFDQFEGVLRLTE
jgi:predicted nucleic acid-binding protein